MLFSAHESLCRAVWMVESSLLDVRLQGMDERQALLLSLDAFGQRDEAALRAAADRFLGSHPNVLTNMDWLSEALIEVLHGVPTLRLEVSLARRLIRIVDPDSLGSLCPTITPAPDDRFDWPAVPLDDSGPLESLLQEGSFETHIHLGGALPPVFYWLLLMGTQFGYEALGWVRSTRRGHADVGEWHTAVVRAALLRLKIAWTVEIEALKTGTPRVFPHLPPPTARAWRAFRSEEISNALPLREAVFRLMHEGLNGVLPAPPSHDWPFAEPLRQPATRRDRSHYAEGERRLLVRVGALLRDPRALRRNPRRMEELRTDLLSYLRIRNAFHALMVHDHGTDGLLRFVETFDRRGFAFGLSGHRPSSRRRRFRRNLIRLERSRMQTALDSQLVEPFNDRTTRWSGPSRHVEMRVSIPRGPLLPRTIRAWAEGVDAHLGRQRSSRVGLVFHLIKDAVARGGDPVLAAGRAQETAEHLVRFLRSHPGVRSFVTGIDVAGSERLAPPRLFLKAFQEIREVADHHRPASSNSPVRLGFTYHVGEDVVDLLTGLRHLDEVVSLLLPSEQGGRVGHALALGDDPRRFYTSRGQTELPVGTRLLDLVWAWGRLAETDLAAGIQEVQKRILYLAGQEADTGSIVRCFRDMALDDPRDRPARSEAELLESLKFRGDAAEIALPPIDESWLQILERLQILLRRRFARRRLCIEVNPTSNLVIGGFLDYDCLPYTPLVEAGLAVSINTDDPGLFMTSLPGELSAMYAALQKKGMLHRQALTWLADRVFDARHSTFLGLQPPLRRREPLDLRYRPD